MAVSNLLNGLINNKLIELLLSINSSIGLHKIPYQSIYDNDQQLKQGRTDK